MSKVAFWCVVTFGVMVIFAVICGLTYLAGEGVAYVSLPWLVSHFGQKALIWLIVFRSITVTVSAMVALVISFLVFYDQVMDPESDLRDECAYVVHAFMGFPTPRDIG
jgi:hypothetical protein